MYTKLKVIPQFLLGGLALLDTLHTWLTAGLAERLTLGGSGRGRKVDITGGLISTGDSLLTTPMRELKRISGLDFLRIYRASTGSHTTQGWSDDYTVLL